MYTNLNNCTVYEKTIKDKKYTFVRHEVGAVYWEDTKSQKNGSDRIPQNNAFVAVPFSSSDYEPKVGDKIVSSIIADEQPPSTAMTIMSVKDFRYGSPAVQHWEVNAE